jgi:hypothetical protein
MIKVYVILGEAVGYGTPRETKQALVDGCGSHARREFKTKAEKAAYIAGLEDMNGLEDFEIVDAEFYKEAKP